MDWIYLAYIVESVQRIIWADTGKWPRRNLKQVISDQLTVPRIGDWQTTGKRSGWRQIEAAFPGTGQIQYSMQYAVVP